MKLETLQYDVAVIGGGPGGQGSQHVLGNMNGAQLFGMGHVIFVLAHKIKHSFGVLVNSTFLLYHLFPENTTRNFRTCAAGRRKSLSDGMQRL